MIEYPIKYQDKFFEKEFMDKMQIDGDSEGDDDGESYEDGESDEDGENEGDDVIMKDLSEKKKVSNVNNVKIVKKEPEMDDEGFVTVKKGKKY